MVIKSVKQTQMNVGGNANAGIAVTVNASAETAANNIPDTTPPHYTPLELFIIYQCLSVFFLNSKTLVIISTLLYHEWAKMG